MTHTSHTVYVVCGTQGPRHIYSDQIPQVLNEIGPPLVAWTGEGRGVGTKTQKPSYVGLLEVVGPQATGGPGQPVGPETPTDGQLGLHVVGVLEAVSDPSPHVQSIPTTDVVPWVEVH